MKKLNTILAAIILITNFSLKAQLSVSTDASNAHASAMLDIKSTDKGMLIPRMDQTQMEAIANPATGLSVYNTEVNAVCYFNGTEWDCMDAESLANKAFVCGSAMKDFRDGQIYSTVQIGDQCWMAENLNIGLLVNGNNDMTDNNIIEKYCYDQTSANCDVYGGLYQWDEMMQYETTEGGQGICPTGWHVPSDDEWKTMEMHLGMSQAEADDVEYRGTDEGGKLKEAGTAHWSFPNTGASNSSGFNGLPGGIRNTGSSFSLNMTHAYFWTSKPIGTLGGWIRGLQYEYSQVYRFGYSEKFGASVRCIRN